MEQRPFSADGNTDAGALMLHPRDVSGLVSFWDFQEEAGEARKDHGPAAVDLQEGDAPVERVGDGIFGPYCAKFCPGSYLHIPAARCGSLRLVRELTLVAWIQRHRKEEK